MSDRAPADAGITPVGAPADAGAFPVGAAVTLAQLDVDPYPVLHRLRAAEPVSWIPAAGQWFVTRRNLAMEVMRDQERYRTDDPHSPIRDTFGAQMLSTEGEEQRRYKSACAPPFTGRAVEATEPLVARVADRWLGALPAAGPVEVREAYAAPVALEV
ncbi:MAG: hypothetical protein HY275_17280, partial [Gemmatimonadetes bacterium]|nr:hypothetical protein [Gemmatimonadota bacterium]